MSSRFVPFDDIWKHVVDGTKMLDPLPDEIGNVYLVRNLYGKVSISVSDALKENESCRAALKELAGKLHETLGAHGLPAGEGVLFVGPSLLNDIQGAARKVSSKVYLVDRLVTAGDWWTVDDAQSSGAVTRWTLYSVKGGVGRSTTAAVLAWHLALNGKRVLVMDLDLESPGISSALLEPERRPDFGITDWFVESLVGQEDYVAERMIAAPRWVQDCDGDVRIAPAHGRDAGEYLAKLGRVYMDTAKESWTTRLKRLLDALEAQVVPDVVLLESRSGLHDIAAATVTDLEAQVLLFATDSESNWTDYEVLFRHWQNHDLAGQIRERLSMVSALTPETGITTYLRRFREGAWDLFRDHLYDDVGADDGSDEFSFDLHDDDAPHDPLVVRWTRGFSAGASLSDLERSTVAQAYSLFLDRFDRLTGILARGNH
ncbi:MAG: tyrosine-protein kinase family protein [Acidobacteria bacterium]|nr:tyrosine-protein kinase family protein [Acidobacteriota bacterium]